MHLNSIRNKVFWLLDALSSAKIKTQLKEIQTCIELPNSTKTESIKKTNLENLILHTIKTTPYYEKTKNLKAISDFPIISKTIVQDNFENFQSRKFKIKHNFKVSTSGSTGVPFFLYQNKAKRIRNRADVIYFLKQNNFKIGSKLYELEVYRKHNKKEKLKSFLQNVIQFDISRFNQKRIEEFLNILKNDKQSNIALLGFASAFEQLSQYLEIHEIYLNNLGVNSIIANSERLNEYTKTTLSKHFDAPVLSRYSSEELGIIAHQTIKSPNSFIINHASYYVELLDLDKDSPVKPGEFGRIVVTDLFNYAMPLIRYDTGDVAIYKINENNVMEFEQIEGRKMDLIYDSQGNIISSFVIYTKFYKYYHLLKQYQFIQQNEKEYEVKLNLKNNKFEFESELINNIKTDFGEAATITITYVDEIPAIASGKRRKVVSNYRK